MTKAHDDDAATSSLAGSLPAALLALTGSGTLTLLRVRRATGPVAGQLLISVISWTFASAISDTIFVRIVFSSALSPRSPDTLR